MLTLADVQRAQEQLRPHLQPTLLEPAADLGEGIWFKLENTNCTRSFKIRGALNAVLSLDEAARARGIITASSGNHALGIAYAAQRVGVSALILMPAHTPKRKVAGARRYGAAVCLDFATFDDAEAKARQLEQQEGLTYISPYNDPRVIAGAGTIGLEILDSLPEVERVVAPVGGGGLISGIGLAIKSLKPTVEMIGVNTLHAPSMHNLFYKTEYPEIVSTRAEALSGGIETGSITIELAKKYVDQIVLVTEDWIEKAMAWLFDEQGWLIEGGGAVGVAAILRGVIRANRRPTAVILSGGNVDGATMRQVLQRVANSG